MQLTRVSRTELPFTGPFFYGWVIVFMAALSMFFSGPGQTYSISVFIDAYARDFGWSSTLMSSMYLFATLLAGSLLFIVGKFIDKYGIRGMSITIALLLGLTCLFNSFLIGPVMLFFGFFMLRFFGQGSMTLIANTLVPQWFIHKRGRAFALMSVGMVCASALYPMLNAWMIDQWNWAVTWRIWAVLLFLLFIPLAFVLIRNKPEDVGLFPDNISPHKVRQKEHSGNWTDNEKTDHPQEGYEVNWTLKEAMRTRAFWLLLYCIGVPALVNTGVVFHMIAILGEVGIPRTASAFILSLMAMVSFPVSFVAGFVVERMRVHRIYTIVFAGYILLLFVLMITDSFAMAVVFGVIQGIVLGFQMICQNIIWPNYFGRKHLGSIKGVSMQVMIAASAFGPLPLAMAYDAFGSYQQMLAIMMVLPFLALFAALFSPPPSKS